MTHLLGLQNSDKPYVSFNDSLGIGSGESRTAESWQILSPVRMQPHGTGEINRKIQGKYHRGLIEFARHRGDMAKPFGDEEIVWTDKVIQLTNGPRTATNTSREERRG